MDSAKQNLASSFVNGFLNCAFGKDKLLSEPESKWIYKNKDEGERRRKFFFVFLKAFRKEC